MSGTIVFLHGLESRVDADLVPIGGKARHLRARYDARCPALDTRAAIALRDRCIATRTPWDADPAAVRAAFATPLARARAALSPDTRLVIGSSFGGAVLLSLLHEEPRWTGACLFLASAGHKLTPHRHLPPGLRAILIHGRHDDVVDPQDSRDLSRTGGDQVQLWEVGDDHPLSRSLLDGTLDAAIQLLLHDPPSP